MKTYTLFQQYIWLVNTIHRAGKISLEEINQRWLETEMSEGIGLARSTFNRHKDAIEDMFGIIIECDKRNRFKYFIANRDVLEEDTIQNWMLSTLSVNNVLSESKEVHDRIVLEQIPSDGEFLHLFIEAMKRSVRIKVTYKRYGNDESTERVLEPIFVKLFNRRWYGMVRNTDPEKAYTFTLAFDRILSLSLTNEKFTFDNAIDPVTWFRNCYGIMRDDEIPTQRVVIRAYGHQPYYLRDLPLHHSQREIATTDEYSDFELTLSPTSDFFTPLLSKGAFIKVLEPQWLADEICQQHLDAVALYHDIM